MNQNHLNPHFNWWDELNGLIASDNDDEFPSRIWGFSGKHLNPVFRIPDAGACFGYVYSGVIGVENLNAEWTLQQGQFFQTPRGFSLQIIQPGTRVLIVQRFDHFGYNFAGGPIERLGRLKYIDRCSDTLLVGPNVKGEPCLNHLHFPVSIDQTEHTHPSSRIGIVARGRGSCVTPHGETELLPGRAFLIPKNGLHKFRTGPEETMDVIAYHPDSDFGPTHQNHPMVNRTLVDGSKIDNSQGIHTEAEIIESNMAKARELARA